MEYLLYVQQLEKCLSTDWVDVAIMFLDSYFGRCTVLISTVTLVFPKKAFCDLLHPHQENAGTVS
jgi:hypothetical protein